VQLLAAKYGPLLATVSDILQQNYTSISVWPHLHDCLMTHACNGLSTPLNDSLFEAMADMVQQYRFAVYTHNNSYLGNTASALLVQDVVTSMQSVVDGCSAPAFTLYSGHDLAPMMPLLAAYGVFNGTWPSKRDQHDFCNMRREKREEKREERRLPQFVCYRCCLCRLRLHDYSGAVQRPSQRQHPLRPHDVSR
jgi:hypothetical protein